MPEPCPFIVWTLQRTGGSNLAQKLMGYAGPPYGLQEPFLVGRTYGAITEAWRRDGDAAGLRQAMAAICAAGVRLKHCVEILPPPITLGLLEASAEAGYRHLFLYRRSSLDRLLSMHFAEVTGIWGPDERAALAPEGVADSAALRAPLPVDKLVAHEEKSVRQLTQCWQILQAHGADPRAVAFEDVYRREAPAQAIAVLGGVLEHLGLARDRAADAAWARQVLDHGDQATNDQYRRMPGVGELAARLARVPGFQP